MIEEAYKIYKNNPPHLFKPRSKYIITGGMYLKRNYLKSPNAKEQLVLSISKGCQKYLWKLEEWVILDNHYHLILEAPETACSLAQMINEIHKFTALWIKKNLWSPATMSLEHPLTRSMDSKKGRVFYNYWDSCLTYERSYFSRINYVYSNPVKHGYTSCAEEYPFGSYFYRCKEDKQELEKLRLKYPCDRTKVRDDF